MSTEVLTVERCERCFLRAVEVVWSPIEYKQQCHLAREFVTRELPLGYCARKAFGKMHGNKVKAEIGSDCPYWLEICMEKQPC